MYREKAHDLFVPVAFDTNEDDKVDTGAIISIIPASMPPYKDLIPNSSVISGISGANVQKC